MRRIKHHLDQLNVRILVVTFEADFLAQAYREEVGLPWPLLIDRDRALYRAYGMLRGSWSDIWGPSTWLAYARELRRGHKLVRGPADWAQRGGDVLVDPAGAVRLHHIGKGPADRPDVAGIVDRIERTETGR